MLALSLLNNERQKGPTVGERTKTLHDLDLTTHGKRPRAWQNFAFVIVIAALVGLAFFANSDNGTRWLDAYHSIPQQIEGMGVWGQLGIIGLMIVHCFVPFPAEFVAITAGSVYGTVYGTFLTWVGAMLGALLSFALTRFFGQPFVEWALPEKQKQFLDKWTEDQGAVTLLVSRFIPIIAFNLINYAAGLTKISWWTFTWTTAIGILPLTALMVYMGSHMRDLSWSWLFAVSAICIAIMAISHWCQRKTR